MPNMVVSQTMPVQELQRAIAGPPASDVDSTAIKYFPGGLILDLSALAAANDIVALQNPYGEDVLIHRAILRVKTAGGTATAVINVDVVDGATDTGDDIFDGVDANAAAISDSLNATDNGTNGEGKSWLWEKAGATLDHLTAKLLVAAAANLVAYLTVHVAPADMD